MTLETNILVAETLLIGILLHRFDHSKHHSTKPIYEEIDIPKTQLFLFYLFNIKIKYDIRIYSLMSQESIKNTSTEGKHQHRRKSPVATITSTEEDKPSSQVGEGSSPL